MDDILKLVLRPVTFVLEMVLELLWHTILERPAWWVGWCTARVLTLGYFPDVGFNEPERAGWKTEIAVDTLGMIVLTLILTGLYRLL